jgi:glycosyltransferase involved in cell wall biosynthesis
MKIATFHSQLDLKRGSSLAYLNVIIALKERGHEVTAHSFQVDDWYREILEGAGIPAKSMDHRHLEPMGVHLILTNNRRARRVFRQLRDEFADADAAYMHGNQWTPQALPILDLPRVYFCDEPPRHYYEPDLINVTLGKKVGKAIGFISRALDKSSDRRSVVTADQVACNSHYTRDYIRRVYGIQATTTYLGVDHDVFAPDPEGEKEDMVVSVGALYPLKAHDFIIRSLARIEASRRPRLVMVGNGFQRAQLEALASSVGVRVEVVSEIDTPRLADLYRRAKLTVIAHVREPFGLVAIESQSCGTPVVAVGEAGLLETVTEDTGVLTERDEAEFSQAVDGLLQDDDLRADMGSKGRARMMEAFNWKKTGAEMEQVLQRAVQHYEGRSGD